MIAAACGGPDSGQTTTSTLQEARAFKAERDRAKNAEAAPRVRVGTCWASVGPESRAVRGPGYRLLAQPSLSNDAARFNLLAKPRLADEVSLPAPRSRRVPIVSFGTTRTTGSIDRRAVRSALRGVEARVLSCYHKELRAKPTVTGTVHVSIGVEPSGRARTVNAAGVSGQLARCVRKVILRLAFPSHSGPGLAQVSASVYFRRSYRSSWRPPSVALPAPAASACIGPVDNAPLVARADALGACFVSALEVRPRLVGRRVVTFAGEQPPRLAAAGGHAGTSELSRCMEKALAGLHMRRPPTATRVSCTVVLDNPNRVAGRVVGRRVEATPASISVDGKYVVDAAELVSPGVSAAHAYIAGSVFGRYWRGDTRSVTFRAHPGLDMRVSEQALYPLRAHTSVHYARAIGVSDVWHIVNPAGTADMRDCNSMGRGVWIEVGRQHIRVGGGPDVRVIPRAGHRHDFAALATHLRAMRGKQWRGRSDADVAGRPGVRYRAVLRALEVAHDAGLFDARIVSVSELPRTPRPAVR